MPLRLVLAVLALSTVFAGNAAAQAPPLYYCDTWGAYYPGVRSCPVPWRAVNPATAAAPQPAPSSPGIARLATPAAPPSFAPLGDGLDEFCKTASSPRSVALCSDRELRALAVERQRAFDEARTRLNPDQQKVLLADQNGWVNSYAAVCGLPKEGAPSLPLATSIQACMAQAGRARIAYLRTYGGSSNKATTQATMPSAPPASVLSRVASGFATQGSPIFPPPEDPTLLKFVACLRAGYDSPEAQPIRQRVPFLALKAAPEQLTDSARATVPEIAAYEIAFPKIEICQQAQLDEYSKTYPSVVPILSAFYAAQAQDRSAIIEQKITWGEFNTRRRDRSAQLQQLAAAASTPSGIAGAAPRPPSAPAAVSSVAAPSAAGDRREEAFIAAVDEARRRYEAAQNDMAKGGVRAWRKNAICGVLSLPRVENWQGEIHSLSSNLDGKGVAEVTIGSSIYVKTWNNSLSDLNDHTLIEPSSAVFRTLSQMKKGDPVHFSGSFVPDDVDCIKEGSLTQQGSMTEPEFIFRFSAASPN